MDCERYKDKDHPIKGRWEVEQWKFNRCPLTYVPNTVWVWVKAYNFYKSGILPNGNGWLKETNKFIEIILFIERKISEDLKEKNAKSK